MSADLVIAGAGFAGVVLGSLTTLATQLCMDRVQARRTAAIRQEDRLRAEADRVRSNQKQVVAGLQRQLAELLDASTIVANQRHLDLPVTDEELARFRAAMFGTRVLADQLRDRPLGEAVLLWLTKLTAEYMSELPVVLTDDQYNEIYALMQTKLSAFSGHLGLIWRDLDHDEVVHRQVPVELRPDTITGEVLRFDPQAMAKLTRGITATLAAQGIVRQD